MGSTIRPDLDLRDSEYRRRACDRLAGLRITQADAAARIGLTYEQLRDALHDKLGNRIKIYLPALLASATGDPGFIDDYLHVHDLDLVTVPTDAKPGVLNGLRFGVEVNHQSADLTSQYMEDVLNDGRIDQMEAYGLLPKIEKIKTQLASLEQVARRAIETGPQQVLELEALAS